MNYNDPKLISLLAGEYVLGNLHGRARARFETLIQENNAIAKAVVDWEVRLDPLSSAIPSVQPSTQVWQKVQQRISPAQSVAQLDYNAGKPSIWDSLNFWRNASMACLLLIVGLLFYPVKQQSSPANNMEYFAVLQDQNAKPVIVAAVDRDQRLLTLNVLSDMDTVTDKVMRLWCFAKSSSEPPMLMGSLTEGTTEFKLNAMQFNMLDEARMLGVTMEPLEEDSKELKAELMYKGLVI